MQAEKPDFYLASSEGYGMEKPRACWRLKRLANRDRDDLLLIKIAPPLTGQEYGLGGRDLDVVLLATRHAGASLFPIKDWPVFVHVARPLIESPDDRDVLSSKEFELIAWAALYQTEEDACLKAI
jgi:hypothetical protein